MSLISELTSLKRRANTFHDSIANQIENILLDLETVTNEHGKGELRDEIAALDFRLNETHENLLRAITSSAHDIDRKLTQTAVRIRALQAYAPKKLGIAA